MKKNHSAALLALSFSALLAGCSSIGIGGSAGTKKTPGASADDAAAVRPADESKDFSPVSYNQVCLLENAAVKSPKLVDAIEAGLKRSGAEVKRLEPGTRPTA